MWKIKRKKNPNLIVKSLKFHSIPSQGSCNANHVGFGQGWWMLTSGTVRHRKFAQFPPSSWVSLFGLKIKEGAWLNVMVANG